jgi:molecular chaperone DnaK (HSP70)
VKLELSTDDEAPVNFSTLYFDSAELWYSRAQLEAAFHQQTDDAVMAVGLALRAAKLTERAPGNIQTVARAPVEKLAAGVDVVVLAGGMAHVPYVRTRLVSSRTGISSDRGRAGSPDAWPELTSRRSGRWPQLGLDVAERCGTSYV